MDAPGASGSIFWRKMLRQTLAQLHLWQLRHFCGAKMDQFTVSLQLARVEAFFGQLLRFSAEIGSIEGDKEPRQKSKFQQRLLWDEFVRNHKDRPLLRRHLRMSYESFCVLLNVIQDHMVERDEEMGALRGGHISIELHLYATLCYLAGGSYSDICFFVASP